MVFLSAEQIQSTQHLSSREAARFLGTGKTSVNKYRRIYGTIPNITLPNAKILTIDIESKPGTYYAWQPKTEYIPHPMMIEPGGMMCFAAKWLGSDEVMFLSEFSDGTTNMVAEAHRLLSEADIVVTYNGDRYDIKRLNNEFLKAGLAPPKPFKSIDLIKTNRNRFDLPYRKLDYLAEVTDMGSKMKHQGFSLWTACMEGDAEAWQTMEEYNVQDVRLTERLYVKLLPWLTNVPHMGMFVNDGNVCPYCGSPELVEQDETTSTAVQSYKLIRCENCEGWSRGNKPLGVSLHNRKVR